MYQQYLHRSADAVGLQGFTSFLGGGGTLEQLASFLVGSPEYFDLHGDSNEAFLSALYEDALGRQADPAGLAGFEQALAGGMSRGQVASVILTSAEYQNDLVQADFQSLLGRQARPRGAGLVRERSYRAAAATNSSWPRSSAPPRPSSSEVKLD